MTTCSSCRGNGNKNGVSDAFRKDMEKLLPEGVKYRCETCGGSGKVPNWPTQSEVTVLTVQNLIDLLEDVEDKSLSVDLEGCDCIGSAHSIEVGRNFVLITRGD